MDPFTISTGVAGFLSLAIELVKILTEYTTTVKSAPSDAQTLLTEVASLSQVLQQLTNFLKKPEHSNVNFRETSVLCSVVTICDVKIKKLHSKLDKFRSAGGIRDRWKWPFQKQECEDLAQTLHHCAQTIELSLAISNCELLSRTSQQFNAFLADHKQQQDSIIKFFSVIPPELQQMQKNISEVLRFVPSIDLLVSDIQEIKNGILQLQRQNKDTRLSEIRTWLSPLEPHKRHHDITSTRIDNTGEWVFNTGAYKAWISQVSHSTPEDRILSFYGMPGAGKTFIASMMIDHLSAKITGSRIGMAYIYCDYRDQKNQNIINIIGTIANQLLELLDEQVIDVVFEQIQVERKKKKHLNLEIAMHILNLVWKNLDHVFICLDAIDELEIGTQTAFMKAVQKLFNTSHNPPTDIHNPPIGISLCFTARPHVKDMVTHVLGNNPHSVTITANDDDIRKYILHQLEIDAHPKLMNDDLRQQLLTKIPENSQGMFLLSALQIQVILQELTIAKRKAAIEKLPMDLYAAFRISLERIRTSSGPARDLGMKILMWTHLARWQLDIQELLHALAVEDGATDLDKENIPLEETILHCCNGLVVIDHEASSVRLVHYSLQEFFKLHGLEYFPDGHKEIARTCLTYLNFTPLLVHCTEERELEWLLNSYRLLEYAAVHWGHHAHEQSYNSLEMLALQLLLREQPVSSVQYCYWNRSVLNDFYRLGGSSPYRYREWKSRELPQNLIKENSGIHVAVVFGLETIVEFMLNTPQPEDELAHATEVYVIGSTRDRFKRSPLKAAATLGQRGASGVLLRNPNININARDSNRRTPLGYAAEYGHEGIIRILLEQPNIDVNAGAPLGWAAQNRHHEGIVRILLEQPNIDINAGEPYALSGAAEYGHEDIVRLLLEQPDIDVNVEEPLRGAAQNGHEGIVRLLLEQPNVDVNAEEPLRWAARNGHKGIVRLLLEQPNIDVNAGEPLGWAAENGHEGIVRLLLEQPNIDVNAGAPLSTAAQRGFEGIVRLLLEQPNIDVNAIGWEGQTALAFAIMRKHTGIVDLLSQHPNIRVITTPSEPSVQGENLKRPCDLDEEEDAENSTLDSASKKLKMIEM